MAENWANVFGQVCTVTFGGNDMGGHAVIDFDEFFDFEPVAPDSMGGEVLTYLLRKKEILVAITFEEVNDNVLSAVLGPFYDPAATPKKFELNDDYCPGYNVGNDSDWTKALVITPKASTAGLLVLTFPYALPVGRFQNIGSSKNIIVPTVFRCMRGSGNYVAKIERQA